MTRPLTADELRLVDEERAFAAAWAARHPAAAYSARLRVRTPAGVRDVLLGNRTITGDDIAMLDWQTAPLAGVFFAYREGDDYEVELDGRELTGTVLRRHLVQFRGDTLSAIERDDGTILRLVDDTWQAHRSHVQLQPRPPEQRARALSPANVQLDPVQRAAVDLPDTRSLLVLGEAGFGKTTVALHRLARLARDAHAARRRFRALVIVPTPGLQRLAARTLADLGVTSVVVDTFEHWAAAQAARLFPSLPRRLSEDAGVVVGRLKRHPALRDVFPRIVEGTAAMRDVRAGYRDRPETLRDLLLHLFGDRELLLEVVERADGALPVSAVDDLVAHTRLQFTTTTERAHAHVDADRLRTLDGKPIDAGTPLGDAGSIDPEDFAVVFALHRRITGGDATPHGTLSHYQHLLLDEAQELAPIELELLGRAVAPGGTVTVAGDGNQQFDPTGTFVGWPEVLKELDRPDHEQVTLSVSYRCPPAVEDFARAVLDPSLPPRPTPTGAPVVATRHDDLCHLVAALCDRLLAVQQQDPRITAAVVCRHVEIAERMHRLIARALPARLVVGGRFSFKPGVDVTSVSEIRGLEFDLVIVPDVDPATYPDRPDARRALYVAATRPLHQLWLATAGPWSPLVPAWLTA
jgi:DNA helicase-2/ATP-dependent DNA helicase PcrA